MDFSTWIRRNLLSKAPQPTTNSQRPPKSNQSQEEEEIHGVTQPLIDHINTFTFDTFKNFQLQDKAGQSGVDETGTSSLGNDLSEWQQRHAVLVLSRVQELSQLRFKLCPRHLKEQQFWCIYFMLVKSHVAEYELRDIQLAKLKKMEQEDVEPPKMSGYEVEMAETKQVAVVHWLESMKADHDLCKARAEINRIQQKTLHLGK